ncbi:MAG: plasmid pRiA4b ORF-3 family protein, partial [Clostridia bacterium]|nr:plasmid pRiA4b ORF-3 family protein [Clostridia bacterium]
ENPLFSWTANWTKVWENHRTEDLVVLVNNATRFTVALYQVKRKDLKNLEPLVKKAIEHTLLHMNINPEIVDEYMHRAGEVVWVSNHNRQTASWVTKAGLECCFHIGRTYNGVDKMFSDTVGEWNNYLSVNYSAKQDTSFVPYRAMTHALSELTGKPAYRYRAFELQITLDLEVYKAVRRIIVPAGLSFERLHEVLQRVFGWQNYHLYEFAIHAGNPNERIARIVPDRECLEYDEKAVLMEGLTLEAFLPDYSQILYTYDLGDGWEHEIELVRVLADYDQESPFLVEANGQTPPEDVGGVGGFVHFRNIMLDPGHPDYPAMKTWAGYWSLELNDYAKRPRVIHPI